MRRLSILLLLAATACGDSAETDRYPVGSADHHAYASTQDMRSSDLLGRLHGLALGAAATKCGTRKVREVSQMQPHPNSLMLYFRCEVAS